MSTDESFFEKMYGASEEVMNAVKKPIVKKRLKRKLHSALDDAEEKKMIAEQAIESARESFEDYDINVILEQRQIIEQLDEMQDQIKAEYFFLFGIDM